MKYRISSNVKKKLDSVVNTDYEKLNEAGKNFYLQIRKKKLLKYYSLIISFFSIFFLVCFLCGLFFKSIQLYLLLFSFILLTIDLILLVRSIFVLRVSDEILIKQEIRKRLLLEFVSKNEKGYVSGIMNFDEYKKKKKNEITKELISNQRSIRNCLFCVVVISLVCSVVGLFVNTYFSLISFLIFIFAFIFAIDINAKLNKNADEYIVKNLSQLGFINEKSVIIKETLSSMQMFRIDYTNQKWAITDNDKILNAYNFEDIINYEVFENGQSRVRGAAGKALVGGWLFGLGGAIVGGSMGKNVDDYCNNLELRIRLKDAQNNEVVLDFIKNQKTSKLSDIYGKIKNNLRTICSALEFMINSKTLEESEMGKQDDNQLSFQKNFTKKEELQELKEMLEIGLIKQEEYDQKKKQILGL